MLKIAANEELRLPRRDVERAILCVDGVGDFFNRRFEARNRFPDG